MATIYSKEFKEEALKLSDEIGLGSAAEKLGISYDTLSNWRCKRNKYGDSGNIGSGHRRIEPGHEKEAALEKEITELKKANDILKEALSFFIQDRKK